MLKIVCGLQFKGNTKYPCPFCFCDNFHKNKYEVITWKPRSNANIGLHNVAAAALISIKKFIVSTLHVKLGLCKHFIKYMAKDCEAFLKITFFPEILKEGIL